MAVYQKLFWNLYNENQRMKECLYFIVILSQVFFLFHKGKNLGHSYFWFNPPSLFFSLVAIWPPNAHVWSPVKILVAKLS